MRVVHVVHGFGTGGMEKGVATIARNASADIEHVIVCLTDAGPSAHLLPPGTRVVELGKRPGHSMLFLFRLARALKACRPDVVHTRNWAGLDGVVASRIAGIRNVLHGEHGWGMDDPLGRLPRRVRIRRLLTRWIREYTCVSREMVEWLRSTIGVRVPVTQIYNGVDAEMFRPAAERSTVRRALGIPPDAFVVTICARLDPIKDHPTLFRAIETVRSGGVAARLLVVGEGPERARLERAAPQEALLLGDRRDVPAILQASDVFALTSLNEGISNTILEAMATGLPVVATRVGGNPELVQDGVTGILVPLGDEAAVAAALLDYAKNPGRTASHGAAGRQRAILDFGIPAMVAAYESIYRRWGEELAGELQRASG
jgi:sugar transferase (PEP-CTERM/EpsH1 system associated)